MIENVSTQLTVFHCLCPLPASRKGLRLPLRSALFGEGGRDWRPWGITVFKILIWGGISNDIPKWKFWIWLHPHSNAFPQFCLKLERCKPQKATCHPTIYDVVNDVKLFPTVYPRIYSRKFWCYPIRRHVTKSSALEYICIQNKLCAFLKILNVLFTVLMIRYNFMGCCLLYKMPLGFNFLYIQSECAVSYTYALVKIHVLNLD